MKLSFSLATNDDVPAIVKLKNAAADDLTLRFGKGHWSYQSSERGVLFEKSGKAKMFVVTYRNKVRGVVTLVSKKPWAIDVSYFTGVDKPVYLIGMTVDPQWQRKGIGKYMIEQIIPHAVSWPAQAIRLDAYDHAAGAGEFYRKCGFSDRGRAVYKSNPLLYFELLIDQEQ